jgi:D-alanine-D-alanine ligase
MLAELIRRGISRQSGKKKGKIAIIYCSLDDFPIEQELESIPDSEEEQIAVTVKAALEAQGYQADILPAHPDRLEALLEYAWIFNLGESIVGYDDLLFKIASGMEALGLRFTGSSARTLWTCQDKPKAKEMLLKHGIETPAYSVIQPGETIATPLTYPLFVKPARLDSHIGVAGNSVVHNAQELEAKVRSIHRLYKHAALVEEYIDGRDINAAVLGNGARLQVLPLSEMVYLPGFTGPKVLTYEATWVEGSAAYANNEAVCPCSLSEPTRDLISAMARNSYNALGCLDYARIDFRLDGDKPYVLEVNPNPCLEREYAGFIVSSQVAGMDYPTTINKILECSRQRYIEPCQALQEKDEIRTDYDERGKMSPETA